MEKQSEEKTSNVKKNIRAAAGVGCIIDKKIGGDIKTWKAYPERIVTIRVKTDIQIQRNIIIVYGPQTKMIKLNKKNFDQNELK